MGLGSYGTPPSISGGALASPAMMGMTMEQVKLWIVSQIINNMQQSVAEASNIFLPPSHQNDPAWARQPPASWDLPSQPKGPPRRENAPAPPLPSGLPAAKGPDGRPAPGNTSPGLPAAPSRPQAQAPTQAPFASTSPSKSSGANPEALGRSAPPATEGQESLPRLFARIVSVSQEAGHAATSMLPSGTPRAPSSSAAAHPHSETGEASPAVIVPGKATQFSHGSSASHPLSGPKWLATLTGWMQSPHSTAMTHMSQSPTPNASPQKTPREEHAVPSSLPQQAKDGASLPQEAKGSASLPREAKSSASTTSIAEHPASTEPPRYVGPTTVHPREQMPGRSPWNSPDQPTGTTHCPEGQDRERAATIPMGVPNHLPDSDQRGTGPGQTPLPTKANEQEFSSTPGWAGQSTPSRSEERPPLGAMGLPTWAPHNPNQPQKSEGFRPPPPPQGDGAMSGDGQSISLGALQQSGQAASGRQQAAQPQPEGGSGGTSVVWFFWTVSLTVVGFCGGALWWLVHSV